MGLHNNLFARVTCPVCHRTSDNTDIEFRFGSLDLIEYVLGNTLRWEGNHRSVPEERPPGGNYKDEGYAECPLCKSDYWVTIDVRNDILAAVTPDLTRAGYGSFNLLYALFVCPLFHHVTEESEIQFHFGALRHDSYHLGDKIRWQGEGFNLPQERPPGGNYQGKSHTFCELCQISYDVVIHVQGDRFTSVVPEPLSAEEEKFYRDLAHSRKSQSGL